MQEQPGTGYTQTLVRDLGLTEEDIQRRLEIVDFRTDDAKRIESIRDFVVANAQIYTDGFFDFLAALEESRALFTVRDRIEEARRLKKEHLLAMVGGHYGVDYAEQRLKLALLYHDVGLEARVFLGAFAHLLGLIGQDLAANSLSEPFFSLSKIAFFDVGVIIDVLILFRQRVISRQQDAIRELSTPVLQIRDRLLLLPIIGVIDTHRARLITEGLLQAVRQRRAKVAVMDVTGVATIDSRVAHHLLQTVNAARLMGANVIVTGISAEVAQSLVALGIDLNKFNTVGDLQEGLLEAERILGYRLVQEEPAR